MTERLRATAIVLAGGRSTRFGRDKLSAELDGVPLLHHAVRAVAGVCDEVLVVAAPSGLSVTLPHDLVPPPTTVRDAEPQGGPLVALELASRTATHGRLLLVGGDMPELAPAVLRRLLAWPAGREGACLVADGWPRPLPLGLDRDTVRDASAELVAAGERSLRALMGRLDLEHMTEADWRALDPDGRSLRDVDRPGDLRTH